MPTIDEKIIALLDQYGHLRFPFGEAASNVPADAAQDYPTTISDPRVMLAIQSYQDFMNVALEPLIAKYHPERRSPVVKADGIVGPATADLFGIQRCGLPDYGEAESEPAIGAGAWKGCHGIGDFHACSVRFTNAAPSWLAPLLPEVLRRVTEAYDEVGLRFYFTLPGEEVKHSPVNIDASFVSVSSGWIGLAVLGSRGITCSGDKLWCRYLGTYKGGSSAESQINQWTSLIKHELGHNCRYNHTSGGIMNPSIISGAPVSWRNDTLWNTLVADFGGVRVPPLTPPVPGPGPDPGITTVTGTLSIKHKDVDLGDYILIPKPRI